MNTFNNTASINCPDAATGKAELRKETALWVSVGYFIVIVAFFGLGGWSAFAELDSAVIAEGAVKIDSNRKRIQHQEGGTVAEIYVKDGDQVSRNDILVRLDETRAKASLAILQSNYNAESARLARLTAERDGLTKINFEIPEIKNPNDESMLAITQSQQRLFDARRKSLDGNVHIIKQQISQLRDKHEGINAQRRSVDRQLALVNDEWKNAKSLLAKGYIERPNVLALERESVRLTGTLGELVSDGAETEKAISEKQQEILQLQNDFERGVASDLRETQSNLADITERLQAAQYVLDHIEIRSPVSGIVQGLDLFSVGEVVTPGATMLEIVPLEEKLLIEAEVSTTEIDNLFLDQDADVRLTAFDRDKTPVLLGKVEYISADALEDERKGLSFYKVRISVDEKQFSQLDGQYLHPGMPAEVIIKTGERTVLGYLTQSVTDAFARSWKET